jgi:hypothetical protein
MIIIRSNKAKNAYNRLPVTIKKAYDDIPEVLSYLEAMIAIGCYEFSSWENALTFSLLQIMKNDPDRLLFCKKGKVTNQSKATLSEFLDYSTGRLLWASTKRMKDNQQIHVSPSHILPDFIGRKLKFQNGEFVNKYNFYRQKEFSNIFKRKIYSPFMGLLLGCSNKVLLKNYREVRNKNTSMNCEEFVAYALLCTGHISFKLLKEVMLICKEEKSFRALYDLFGIQKSVYYDNSSDLMNSLDKIRKSNEPQILFETGHNQQVSHMLLYNKPKGSEEGYIYELAFGKKEQDFRVIKTKDWAYVDSPFSRNKKLKVSQLSNINDKVKNEDHEKKMITPV